MPPSTPAGAADQHTDGTPPRRNALDVSHAPPPCAPGPPDAVRPPSSPADCPWRGRLRWGHRMASLGLLRGQTLSHLARGTLRPLAWTPPTVLPRKLPSPRAGQTLTSETKLTLPLATQLTAREVSGAPQPMGMHPHSRVPRPRRAERGVAPHRWPLCSTTAPAAGATGP